jgi:FkbM family methyltransferase
MLYVKKLSKGLYMFIIKKLLSKLPFWIQQNLKKYKYGKMVQNKTFTTNEPEFFKLNEWVKPGDYVIDAGANIGHYTTRLSELVGSAGRVFAFEPLPQAFELLTFVSSRQGNNNTSLINSALSDTTKFAQMDLPRFDTGLVNYYVASIKEEKDNKGSGQGIYCLRYDGLEIQDKISFVKMDVEDHEIYALKGMKDMIVRDKPVIVIEGLDKKVEELLTEIGYSFEHITGSPNRIFTFK